MGGCCYTPRRTQFLWWYWLLLASVVGIPMLLACLYVDRHPVADEMVRKRIGKQAAGIFWFGALISAILAGILSYFLLCLFYPPEYQSGESEIHMVYLIIGYLGGLASCVAIGRGRWPRRVLAGAGAVVGYGLYFVVGFLPFSLPEFFWLPAVCAGVAHFFVCFAELPTPRTARAALLAVVTGACLFWAVAKYGRWVNFALSSSLRGYVSVLWERDIDLEPRK